MKKKIKGIWFYGLSGSGKSYISKKIFKKKKNAVLVDGDLVRKLVSNDLGYLKSDREKQINRIFGICAIIIKSKKFPIASTVYFNKKLNVKCNRIGIIPIKVDRKNFGNIFKNHKTYKNKKNVVGKDIFYENFKTLKIINSNNEKFIKDFKIFNFLN